MRYTKGYKYRLEKPGLTRHLPEFGGGATTYGRFSVNNLIDFDANSGLLHIYEGYSWDGPSGPALDTDDFMLAALVHDALYQLMRAGGMPQAYRAAADRAMRRLCKEAGMPWWRRWYTYQAVRWFAAGASKNARKVYTIGP